MKTIEERIEELARTILPCNKHCRVNLCSVDYCNFDYEECEIYKNIYKALTEIAEYQKSIDDANIHERFEKVLNGQKCDLIDEACKCFCKTCMGQCKDSSHCDTLEKFRNELNSMEE